jgi:hypothetical protein
MYLFYVKFDVFTAVTVKNANSWELTPCGSCKNQRFGGTYHFQHQGGKNERV